MLESGVGSSINIEAATLSNFTYPADIFPSGMFYQPDLAAPEVLLSGRGQVTASQLPGIPYEPVPDRLKAQTVQQLSFQA